MAATAERKTDLLDAAHGVKDVALVPAAEANSFVAMVERLAANPAVDVVKLEKILDMQERILAHDAEAAFNAAFADMLAEIPTVIERGKTDKGTYAELEDIVGAIRPILKRFGFALSHRTEWPEKALVKIVGILTHRDGHSRQSEFLSSADQSGSKNAIQALGSAVSYGRRYTTKDLLCIVTSREDDDGQNTSKAGKPDVKTPEGYEDWLLDLEAVADEGTAKLHAAWNTSKADYRRHLLNTSRTAWETLKKKAAKVPS